MNRVNAIAAAVGAALLASTGAAQAGTTLDSVKQKGFIQCGVNQGLPGFSAPTEGGSWAGLDVDFCRAMAAALFGDASKVKFTPLSAKERFTALQSGEVDVLSRNTTWTLTRDSALGLNFAGVIYYDGQGFMVRKDLGVKSAKELDGATICVQTGTTTELNVGDYFRANNLKYVPVVFEKSEESVVAYDTGRCDVFTTDASGLYAERIKLKDPDAHIVLPEIISKEPLGPVVRQGDDEWFNLAKWTLFALVNAEELGLNSANVEAAVSSENPEVRRFVGAEGDKGKDLGLDNAWALNVVKQVGNYGEVFDRNVGLGSPLKIERGLNALWSNGGLQYAPPVR